MRPASAGALADHELDGFFAPLLGAPLIALAVSGGADSLALLDAVDRWRRRPGRPAVIVLTVDHRLRRGSAREAANVVKVARARRLKAEVLTWKGPRPTSDIEGAARTARYRLLVGACREAGATHLVVAHHLDDLAETFLLRLKRGAGVFGLAAMRPLIAVGDVTIFRPFLGVGRDRLAATTAAAGLSPVVDTMNTDPRFDRARLRRVMPTLADQGLSSSLLAAAALRLADVADAIDEAATAFIAEAVDVDDFAIAWLEPARFAAARGEVRQRVLVRLLLAIGGDDYPPRFERLSGLLAAMVAHDGKSRFKRTLAGAVIEVRGGRFAVYRELGRVGLPSLPVKSGSSGIWDGRFLVTAGRPVGSGLTVGPLGEAGRREVGATGLGVPAGALAALPAFRRKGRILAVPALSFARKALPVVVRPVVRDRLLQPPLFPDLASGR